MIFRAKIHPWCICTIYIYNYNVHIFVRTVYSVLNRSPAELIEEIILVDDASTLPHLGDKLSKVDKYILEFSKLHND